MNIPENLKFTEHDEWIRIDGDVATIGITDFAQSQLGDISFVEVETVGEVLDREERFGNIEAVKTSVGVFMPVSGEVLEFNEELESDPALINNEPYEGGWIIKVKVSNPEEANELMDAAGYEKYLEDRV
ncbi:glycine cleavage system protein GcvH [Bacteroidales bacterium OttesenSCG-928-K03]|nr:glycine cleavage system protein GcvH [Odoribacter sp. OttesenSCG-928-L07]MDL2240801.1 glycine cleavage system protein GcvH [Bacteroidales bacterium OttesenSCG-928-K22]MDL2242776.1 glycine cleavage system protein GcvH [Bacteroidales bacterium OttesenSCG-928-K03]